VYFRRGSLSPYKFVNEAVLQLFAQCSPALDPSVRISPLLSNADALWTNYVLLVYEETRALSEAVGLSACSYVCIMSTYCTPARRSVFVDSELTYYTGRRNFVPFLQLNYNVPLKIRICLAKTRWKRSEGDEKCMYSKVIFMKSLAFC